VAEQFEERVLRMLDALSVGIVAIRDELRTEFRNEIGGLRGEMRDEFADVRREMREGFGRVERRLGHVENRVEDLEVRVTAIENRPVL
jgi:hypothetical protein